MNKPRITYLAAFVVAAFVATAALTVTVAQAASTTVAVPGTANLYHDTSDYPGSDPGTAPVVVPLPVKPGQDVNVTASGCAVDSGSLCTGPDGLVWYFRGLPVYSLIGRWSTDVSVLNDSTAVGAPFFVGSSASLTAPTSGPGPYYLFFGDNDGVFADNAGAYSVDIEVVETKADVLVDSGVPGKGLSDAPGLGKVFNPKSQAKENAGKKK